MMHWLKQLRISFGASFLCLVCLIYFTQGFKSFVWTAVSYQLKDRLKLSSSASQSATSIAFFPWSIKPLYFYGASFAGDLQSISWVTMALGGICWSLLGGYALTNLQTYKIFLLFLALPAIQLFSSGLVEEKSVGNKEFPEYSNLDKGTNSMNGQSSLDKPRNNVSKRKRNKKCAKRGLDTSENSEIPEIDGSLAMKWFHSMKMASITLLRASQQPIIFRPVDVPQEIKRDSKTISELQDEKISHEPQVFSPSSKFLPYFKMREKFHLGADHSPQSGKKRCCIRDWRMESKSTLLFSAALCFTVLMAHGVSGWTGEIHGRVVCDVCGDSSIGPEDHILQGAEVAVLCITKSGEVLNYQAFTNVNGIYTVAETMPESDRWDACLARPISSFHHHCTHLGDGSTGVKFSYTLPSGYSHTVRPFVYRPTTAPAYCN